MGVFWFVVLHCPFAEQPTTKAELHCQNILDYGCGSLVTLAWARFGSLASIQYTVILDNHIKHPKACIHKHLKTREHEQ